MKYGFLMLGLCATIFLTAQVTYIHCGYLVDVEKGDLLSEQTIVVESDHIRSVYDGYMMPSSAQARVVDLRDAYVMPGLMDMHVHLEMESNKDRYMDRFTKEEADLAFDAVGFARLTLLAGFTTVRDLGGSGVNIALRNAIEAGKIVGPRVYTSGKSIATTGGHADPSNGMKRKLMGDPGPREGVINGPAEAAKAVRQRYKNGADLIKITATGGVLSVAKDGKRPQFSQDELDAIISTADDYDLTTAAHAHGAEGMKRAVMAGITSIEHGTQMTEEVMDLMIERGTFYVPTITAGKAVAENAKVRGYYPAVIVPKAVEIGPQIQETFGKAYHRGVSIAFGTDAGVFPHGENGREFAYMAEMGMPMMECIQSATMTAAQLLKIDEETGSIKSGKWADIVATSGNPLADPGLMEQISFVMKAGVVYKLNGKEVIPE